VPYNFKWGIVGMEGVHFDNEKILTLTAEERAQKGINQPGQYYNYSLSVYDDTRLSSPHFTTVQVAPQTHPNDCMLIELRNIDLESILAYTLFDLMLQLRVRKFCNDIDEGPTVWESLSVDWVFWGYLIPANNYTLLIPRDNLAKLPRLQDLRMRATTYYKIWGIEYIARTEFTFLVAKNDLISVVDYDQVVNVRQTDLDIDASESYDPEAIEGVNDDVPVTCKWYCPTSFTQICASVETCRLFYPKDTIRNSLSFSNSIKGQFHLFELTLTKDARKETDYVYVTVVDGDEYPNCYLRSFLEPSLNTHLMYSVEC